MGAVICPRCGAPQQDAQPDPLARCEWCGALLASAELPTTPLRALRRVDAETARLRVARALVRAGGGWVPGTPQPVYYPFSLNGSARRPFAPLATLPPLLATGWRGSGADLVRDAGDDGALEELEEGAARVPASLPPLPGHPLVHYPFYRVPLRGPAGESAGWCDGVDGQVVLPEELSAGAPRPAAAGLRGPALTAAAFGGACGLVLPFPWSLVPLGAAAALAWTRVGR
jgi:hypothetical protein